MAFSKIDITFNSVVAIGKFVFFQIEDEVDTRTFANEECSAHRTAPYQFDYNTDQVTPNIDALDYSRAWELDYNNTELYVVSVSNNVVTITATIENYTFSNFSSDANVTAVITNAIAVTPFAITSVTYATKIGSECTDVVCTVTCSSEVTDVTSPVTISGNTGNTVSFDVQRGIPFTLEVNNGVLFRSAIKNSPYILPIPTVDVFNTPSGATANILAQTALNITYSLDDISYQAVSTFPGLGQGSFTAYIKDDYGCVKSVNFDVDAFTTDPDITDPVIYVSESNSFRFKKVEDWDNISIYKNDRNTLSCEEIAKLGTQYIQKWQKNDIVTTQVKTTHTLTAKTTDWDDNDNALTVIKKTDNIGKKDMRDAIGYSLGDGRYGFYFMSGNTYDYDTENQSGTYELYGEVPNWAKVNQYFAVDSGTYYKITEILYVEAVNAEVLIINADLTGNPTAVTVKTTYNLFDWEIYEFDVDMATLGEFYVVMDFTHIDFDNVTHISELQKTYDTLGNTLYVTSKHSKNNDVAYITGIVHKMRLEYISFDLANDNETDIHKTDDSVYQLDSANNLKKDLVLVRLTTGMVRIRTKQFSLDTIFINGQQFVTESMTSPEKSGVTNLYKLGIKLLEKGVGIDDVTVEAIPEIDILEVPALVQGDSEFVKQ